jgi:hypothetical protein
MNHSKNAAPKIVSTIHANGGQAITIIANASHAAMFRDRDSQWFVEYGEIATANRRSVAPE